MVGKKKDAMERYYSDLKGVFTLKVVTLSVICLT